MSSFTPRAIRRALACAAIAALASVVACDLENPLEGVALRLNFAATDAVAGIVVLDAATGMPLDVPVTVEFSGADAARIVDLAGQPLPAAGVTLTQTPMLGFGLTGAVPTLATPVRLTVHVRAPGYLETAEEIEVHEARPDAVEIRLVSVAAPPEGAASGTASGQATDGTISSAIAVQTAIDPVTGGRSEVTIPAGTVVRDRNGVPLDGQLTASVVHFNSISDSALAAFPGGFDARVENPPAGAAADLVFTTAGFAAVKLTDQSGRAARTFTQPLTVAMDVSPETYNPNADRAVQPGDTVPYWSFDVPTARWRYEGKVALSGPLPNGNLRGTFTTTHLSYFNLDWYGDRCSGPVTIRVIGKRSPAILRYRLMRGTQLFRSWTDGDTASVLNGAPRGRARIVVANHATGAVLGSLTVADLCAGASIAINEPEPLGIHIDLTAVCADGSMEVRPNAFIYVMRRTNAGLRITGWTWITNGSGGAYGLQPNAEYRFHGVGYYEGQFYHDSIDVRAPASGVQKHSMRIQLGAGVC